MVGSPRLWLPLFSVYEDSVVAARGPGADEAYDTIRKNKRSADKVIDALWNDPANQDVVVAFMTNKLCVEAAKGNADAIEAFKKYAVQDYFYLIDWFKFRVLRLATLPHDDFKLEKLKDELESVSTSLNDYVGHWYDTCIKPESQGGLGIDPGDFNVERTIGEVAYSQFLLNNARSSDWYSLHIILIGCYWGWSKIALQLYCTEDTDRSTIFFKHWIKANIDIPPKGEPQMAESARALSVFLNENQKFWASEALTAKRNEIFRMVLRLEVGLFNSAYDDVVKKRVTTPGGPIVMPVPHSGHIPTRERQWRRLLGLEAGRDSDDADEDGMRSEKI
ncbi:hypothetical protein GSI_11039 [Ganoderma sinense ZZ0214-1]|uniref:Thiaminase-2/PQQC domain-containing protein n=1 Tax=Ganoderma sinense ZZ0214-1 TaxID=1077348 RepID=A0A2G8RZB0_9APHY|nr:hypothetical protein GSI_11039 [Ganoderma sinense ZZ0214-1]